MAFRREQKLRLDKLLVQQQIEEEAEALDGEDGEDIKEQRSEKISTDEVRRLMLHGKKAIVVRNSTARRTPVQPQVLCANCSALCS